MKVRIRFEDLAGHGRILLKYYVRLWARFNSVYDPATVAQEARDLLTSLATLGSFKKTLLHEVNYLLRRRLIRTEMSGILM
jgi:hypothetical protein